MGCVCIIKNGLVIFQEILCECKMFSLGNTGEVHAEAEASQTRGVGQILKLVRMTFSYLDLIPFHFYLSKPTRVDYKNIPAGIYRNRDRKSVV